MKLGDLFIKLGLKSQEFEQGINKAKGSVNGFASMMGKVGGMLAAFFAVDKIIAFGAELAKLGGEAEGVRAAFERIGGPKYMDDLKRATAGTVSELNLMKRTVQAANFGLPVENLASLFEFATKRAQETGQSVDYLVDSIVLGIGRKSPLILDNLGISAVQLTEKLNGVAVGAASVAEIAGAVAEIAADSMRVTGGVIETNAIKIQNLSAVWADFKMELATSESVIKTVSSALDVLGVALENLDNLAKGTGNALRAIFGSTVQASAKKAMKEFDDFVKSITQPIGQIIPIVRPKEKQAKTIADIRAETDALKASLEKYAITQTAEINATLSQIDTNEKLLKSLTELGKEREKQREVSAIPFTPIKATKVEQQKEYSWLDAPGVDMGLSDIELKLQQTRELTAKFQEDWMNDWGGFQAEFASLIDSLITDSIYVFAESLGQLAGGEINLNGFFNNVLNQIGNFAKQLGGMLIAFGVAKLAFGESLANFFSPVGAGALIAAGAALVAVGGAISSATRAKSGGGGGGGGTGMFNQSYNVNVAAAASPTSATLFLKGDDIYLSGQRNIYKRGAIG